MHEFWLWCGFKSLKILVETLKNICENLCKSLNLKYVEKLLKMVCEKPLK
jgi:hypothetical protein